ncbi:MAG: SUMF1/EgtB/PvdO family nonheme iron enzyme [Bacteroidales bacterium]|nr:SUMF1/EgtB/PvdO family nonheme iron enzyme [Bacteroidales bacterium]
MGEKIYDVFISYRRDGGSDTAKHLRDLLVRDGYSVCFDIDTLREGRFDEALLRRVDECTDFILVVDKRCFNRTVDGSCKPEDDWLRTELARALHMRKNVVPVLLAGAVFPGNLPDDIKEVKWHSGPTHSQEYFDQFYEKLKEYLHSRPSHTPRWVSWLKRHLSAIIILLLLVALGIVLMKGGMLPFLKTVTPFDTVAQLAEDGDTVPEALLHQMSAQEQPVIQTAFPVEQKQEEPVQKSSASVSVRQEKGNLLFTVNGVEFKMVKVEGGTFWMGATKNEDEDALADESPRHKVTLSDYYICETEVTQGLWKVVMGYDVEDFKGNNYPAYNVSYSDVQKFIMELRTISGRWFRLPTEAEWEYAALGGRKSKGYRFSGSNNLNEVAWCGNCDDIQRVKRKKGNELGIYDMSGNVEEWCSDWYGEYNENSVVNPKGPEKGYHDCVVVRGGSIMSDPEEDFRIKSRAYTSPSQRGSFLGFRLVMEMEQ